MKPIIPKRVYAKLFSRSYLSDKRVRVTNFTNLIDFLTWEKDEKRENGRIIVVYSLDDNLQGNFKDIVEKIGFMLLSYDALKELRKKRRNLRNLPLKDRTKIFRKDKMLKGSSDKYYFYNFIIYTKASLDSIAVTINSFFNFDFKGGQIDFGNFTFRKKVESLNEFKNFS